MDTNRYQVRPIAEQSCSLVRDEVIASYASIEAAKDVAARESGRYQYGCAVVDIDTGEVDFGAGFGMEVPDPSAD